MTQMNIGDFARGCASVSQECWKEFRIFVTHLPDANDSDDYWQRSVLQTYWDIAHKYDGTVYQDFAQEQVKSWPKALNSAWLARQGILSAETSRGGDAE